jgi:hypothetical protein
MLDQRPSIWTVSTTAVGCYVTGTCGIGYQRPTRRRGDYRQSSTGGPETLAERIVTTGIKNNDVHGIPGIAHLIQYHIRIHGSIFDICIPLNLCPNREQEVLSGYLDGVPCIEEQANAAFL